MFKYIGAKDSKKIYNNSVENFSDVLTDGTLHVPDDIKSVYNPGQFIFSEISNLRLEVSRLGILVRLNNENSPSALRAYHAHIYSLLIPCSVIIGSKTWNKIDELWKASKIKIDNYESQKLAIPNKKIPDELIYELDRLHRTALLLGQKAGLGLLTEKIIDIDSSIENAITG